MSIKQGQYSTKCFSYLTQVLGVDGSNNFADGYAEREIPRQYWWITSSGAGHYIIQNTSTKRYLSYSAVGDGRAVTLTDRNNGARVDLQSYTGAGNQQWYFQHRDPN
ncbi:hypothetical protein BKA57DRAFT_499360 [Linnemannia elongata]|nr:hypothetical protein BKA57DRAFT_499360 [Linnemannia elongata]